ncbi:hypothetical protein COO91_06274 [Nostoc flagelliforme CCNUN1]|uniref:Uncharacterized protein n=1 Tax=Nostoc flagelliforme CCNUN1 TaxID=2038116 RepID=A0A2K8SZS9_9NOSO|nr:hypothetical protein COO91_06274 [Nostoc flagelliforme CCNUN1]
MNTDRTYALSVDRKLLEVDERMRVSAVGFETGNHSQLQSL